MYRSKECFENLDGSNHIFMPVLYLSLDGDPERGLSESEDKMPKNTHSQQQRSGLETRDSEKEDCSSEASPKQGKHFEPESKKSKEVI